jgi:hypothetical protein
MLEKDVWRKICHSRGLILPEENGSVDQKWNKGCILTVDRGEHVALDP